jgi:hypothetical protein
MPARGDLSAGTEGRRPKASQEGTREGRVGGCRLWGFDGFTGGSPACKHARAEHHVGVTRFPR